MNLARLQLSSLFHGGQGSLCTTANACRSAVGATPLQRPLCQDPSPGRLLTQRLARHGGISLDRSVGAGKLAALRVLHALGLPGRLPVRLQQQTLTVMRCTAPPFSTRS